VGKIVTIKKAAKISARVRRSGKKVSLITGCFDIIHIGHVELFRFTKKYSDIVILCLESDRSIRLTKGKGRPINLIPQRSNVLRDLVNVNYIIKLRGIYKQGSKYGTNYYTKLVKTIYPTFIATSVNCDSSWKKKKELAMNLGVNMLQHKGKKLNSSSRIAEAIERSL